MAAKPAAAPPAGAKAAAPAAAKPNAWEPWVKNLLKDEKNVKAGGIYGENGACWHQKDVGLTPDQAKKIVEGIKAPKKFTDEDEKARIGIFVGPIVAPATAPPKFLYLKCVDQELTARKGPTTLMAKLTKKALVVVLTKDGANPGNVMVHNQVAVDLGKKGF